MVRKVVKTEMLNAGRCPKCNAFLIAEDFADHKCKVAFQGIQTIIIDHYYETHADKDGHKIVFAKGLNGYLYRLVICKHNPSHTANRKFTDEDANREGDVTLLKVT
jgi:hypothetical protein